MSSQAQSILQQAKQRMKSGYWISRMTQPEEVVQCDHHGEELYSIVCSIHSSDSIVTNPIDRLMDKSYYNKLNQEQKSCYILQISRKYHELTRRYYEENKQQAKECDNILPQ